ncbi:phosphonate ABC transporter ATP-binding protein [Ornithinimicrobium pratense]|uniref:Phosphonate ABC transporter ATP-binding protein n=2 Tax=Ornithinimicrobium pratense TaxID=2593973 RepID=A0A5J6V8Q4_9MICO|nr:phosphonate ABC transporter ATP-binding protein [Ornithinimicrobium pratense]
MSTGAPATSPVPAAEANPAGIPGVGGGGGPGQHLSLRGVTKRFAPATTAVDDVTLEIEPGSFTILLGLSGSGKSTLLRLINGLHTPTSGRVMVLGVDVGSAGRSQLRAVRREVGMVFQQFHLVGSMSTLENVCTGALGSLRGPRAGLFSYPREVRARALEQLERVGLADQRFQRADTLSGGQQQRVAVARALVQRPKMLLADEPVASLDPESSHQIMSLISRIAVEDELTVVCSLHQVDLALRWGHRVLGLRKGSVVLDKPTDRVSADEAMGIYASVAGT